MTFLEWMQANELSEREAATLVGLTNSFVGRSKSRRDNITTAASLQVQEWTEGEVTQSEMLPLETLQRIYGNKEGVPGPFILRVYDEAGALAERHTGPEEDVRKLGRSITSSQKTWHCELRRRGDTAVLATCERGKWAEVTP